MTETIAFLLPHFGHGGAEGVVLRLLQGVDRTRFSPLLLLQRRRGELLDAVPADVPIFALNHPRPPLCIRDLARLYARNRVALAVTATNATNLYSVLASRLAGTAVGTLVTEHTPLSVFLAEASYPFLRRAAIRRIYPHATFTGGPLDEIGAELDALIGPAAPPYVTLPNPVVESVGPLQTGHRIAYHVVSVGRLAPEKRFDLLIDAFAEMRRALPEARLTIFGEGSERAALEARIRERNLAAHVSLPGYTSDLDSVHRDANLFVCTSRREGLGNAIIEAMARGVPVVSVDCPFGPRRLLRDGAAGWLVREHTPLAIASAMHAELTQSALRDRHVEAAFEVAREYRIDHAVAAYEKAFDRALTIGRRARNRRAETQ